MSNQLIKSEPSQLIHHPMIRSISWGPSLQHKRLQHMGCTSNINQNRCVVIAQCFTSVNSNNLSLKSNVSHDWNISASHFLGTHITNRAFGKCILWLSRSGEQQRGYVPCRCWWCRSSVHPKDYLWATLMDWPLITAQGSFVAFLLLLHAQ